MSNVSAKKGRRRVWPWLLLPVAVVAVAGGAGWWRLQQLGLEPRRHLASIFAPPFEGRTRANILILGVDSDSAPHRADTIMVAAVDLAQRRIGVISVPRDFRAAMPRHGEQKVNAAYALGGVELTRETVEDLIGVPCDYHIKVTVEQLARLIDALGGVELNVDKRMYYRDRAQRLVINLQPGVQRLNGDRAVGYVRYRHDAMGDLARIRRQHAFMRAVMREALRPKNLARLPRLLGVFADTVETDLTVGDLRGVAELLESLDPDRVKARTLPGTPVTMAGISYLEPDCTGIARDVNLVLLGLRPRVAIVNATAIPGVEAGLIGRLTGQGYEVTEVRFSSHPSSTSQIMDRVEYPDETAEIRGWLNCGELIPANGAAVDGAEITVVLGTDYLGQEDS